MAPSPLTVVQVGALSTDGDGEYRVHQPAAALAALDGVEVYNVHYLSRWRDEAALAADVLVVYFTIDIELFRVFEQRRRLGKATFCEINDYFLAVPTWNPVHSSWSNPRRQHYLVNMMARSDAVQVSSAPLADHFRRHNERITVFRNHIARLPLPRPPRSAGPVVVGWGGSAGHLEDMKRLAGVLVGWLARHPEVRLSIMGDPLYASLFDAVPRDRFHFAKGGTLADYVEFVRTLDIGIAPVVGTEYNRCRSDVKFLEYAANGAVAVVQRLDPYLDSVRDGETGFLFDDDAQLVDVLERLVSSRALCERVSGAAYEYIRRERLLEQHVGERLAFYETHMRRVAAAGARGQHEIGRFAAPPLRALPGLEQRGPRHWQLEPRSSAERKFLDGLSAMDARDGQRAVAAFAEATRLAPDYYQAYYYSGRCLSRAGRVAEAEQAYQAAARINPAYSRPLSALADLHGGLAAEYRRRSDELNPPLP